MASQPSSQVRDIITCLREMIENDEDMLALLLTERRALQGSNRQVAHRRHEQVVESYHRKMSEVYQEVFYLRKRVESTKSCRSSTTTATASSVSICIEHGWRGLGHGNHRGWCVRYELVSGLEEHPTAFGITCAVSAALAGSIYFGTWAHLRQWEGA